MLMKDGGEKTDLSQSENVDKVTNAGAYGGMPFLEI